MSAGVRVQASSRIVRERWYYDDTYLRGDDGQVSLFVRHFVEYVTKSGNTHRRFTTDVIGLPDDEAISGWVEEHSAIESGDPEGVDRSWLPDEWAGASR